MKIRYFTVVIILALLTACSNLDVQTLNQKAVILMHQGNIDGAISRLESINDINPNFPQTYYNLAIAYDKKGKFDESIKALNIAIKLKNDFSDAYYSLGTIYEEVALADIDKLKTSKDKKAILKMIVDNYNNSQNSFSLYLKTAKNPTDKANTEEKIKEIENDIKKYESMFNANHV